MNECPETICLLMTLWEADDRFVPVSVCGWSAGDYKPATPADWRWWGGVSQSGGNLYLREFHTWNKLDQQTLLETALGKIFSVGSAYHKTVIQLHGKVVSVKHRELKEIRRFSAQPTMIGNLFTALIKMSELEWIPSYLGKDGCYYYTEEDRSTADTQYEIGMATAAKCAMVASQKNLADVLDTEIVKQTTTVLPVNDPFYGSSMDRL